MAFIRGQNTPYSSQDFDFNGAFENRAPVHYPTELLAQGRGKRLPKFSYMHHPTKNDVTSGLKCDSQLVSQSEKMAFRVLKISLYL